MNFYDVLAAKNWSGGNPTTNFFDLLFAQSMGGGEQWQTYDGTLPATFNANGDDMRQYQVYGANGGVGDRTVQLFDKNATDTTNGYVNNAYLNSSGQVVDFGVYPISHWQISEYISIEPNESYYQKSSSTHQSPCLCEYDSSFAFLKATSFGGNDYIEITTTAQTRFVRLSVWDDNTNNFVMFTKGTTPPETYVPFGYEVDISTSDGTNVTTTPIYIGDKPLEKDEYVDFGEQKVYRMIDGTLTPIDPPVPLPALPTCEGETVVDYSGSGAAPEKVVFEYKKGGN